MPRVARRWASNDRVLDYCGEIAAALTRAQVAVAELIRIQRDVISGKVAQDAAADSFGVGPRGV